MQGQLIFTMTRSRDHIALVRFSYFFSGVSQWVLNVLTKLFGDFFVV